MKNFYFSNRRKNNSSPRRPFPLLISPFSLLFVLCSLLFACATVAAPSGPDDLDITIREASNYLNQNLPRGSKVAIISIQSDYNDLSEYVIDELIANAINDRTFSVVDRAQLEKIRMELDFQLSGEVSDESARAIGEFLGAQTIVTGAISELADRHRLRLRALDVETAQVQGQYNRNVNSSPLITALSKGGRSGTASYAGRTGAARTGRTEQTAIGSTVPAQASAESTNPTRVQQTVPAQAAVPVYKIGDTGPAGGIVFYDKGNNIGGWRYLEAAPVDLGPTNYIENPGSFPKDLYQLWERTYEKDGRAVGRGIYNTEYLMQIAQARGGFTWAVRLCDNYEHGGFDNWFMPSRDELNFMYGNLYLKGLGNFRPEEYWSSTTWTDTWGSYRAWYINFSDGKHDNVNAGQQRRVRPIRQL
jgi:TolB-like protein